MDAREFKRAMEDLSNKFDQIPTTTADERDRILVLKQEFARLELNVPEDIDTHRGLEHELDRVKQTVASYGYETDAFKCKSDFEKCSADASDYLEQVFCAASYLLCVAASFK